MNKFKRFLYKAERLLIYFISPLSPALASKIMYFAHFKKPLNLKSPATLNEKLMYLKLTEYKSNKLVTDCTDKYGVRKYVCGAGCGDILNELIRVWEDPEDINFGTLPESFVLKLCHGSGYNIFYTPAHRPDTEKIRKTLKKWRRQDYWRYNAEPHYKGIQKRIICEKYLSEGDALPTDYKVYCFNGKPLYILVCEERAGGSPKFFFFDSRWKFCPITRDGKGMPLDFTLPKPRDLEKMLDYAAKLSAPFPFVRVDFYETEKGLIFGEMTFTPSACLDTGRLPETDIMFGDLLELPKTPTKSKAASHNDYA